MRIIGHIEHPTNKITVLEHNNKITLQFESGLLSQSYAFRDGSSVSDFATAKKFCTPDFLAKIDNRFIEMNKDYFDQLTLGMEEEFPVII